MAGFRIPNQLLPLRLSDDRTTYVPSEAPIG